MYIMDREVVETKSTDKRKAAYQTEVSELKGFERLVSGRDIGQKYEVAIMGGLTAADLGDFSYWETIGETPEDREDSYRGDAVPMLRWMSVVGTPDWTAWNASGRKGRPPLKDNDYTGYYVIAVNEIANIGFWDLMDHPELQYKLLCSVGVGTRLEHQWLPAKSPREKASKIDGLILQAHPNINSQELALWKRLYTREDIIDLAYAFLPTEKEIEEVKKELDDKE